MGDLKTIWRNRKEIRQVSFDTAVQCSVTHSLNSSNLCSHAEIPLKQALEAPCAPLALVSSQLEKPEALLSFCCTALWSLLLIWPAPAAGFASLFCPAYHRGWQLVAQSECLLHRKRQLQCFFTIGFQQEPYRRLTYSYWKNTFVCNKASGETEK